MSRSGRTTLWASAVLVPVANIGLAFVASGLIVVLIGEDPLEAAEILMLGALFVVMGIVTDGIYAVAAGGLGDWLRRRPRVVTAQRWFAGGIFITLGIATALTGTQD